jgi:hypothetical protein
MSDGADPNPFQNLLTPLNADVFSVLFGGLSLASIILAGVKMIMVTQEERARPSLFKLLLVLCAMGALCKCHHVEFGDSHI